MATKPRATSAIISEEKRYRSVFQVPANFFDSCGLLSPSATSLPATLFGSENSSSDTVGESDDKEEVVRESSNTDAALTRWTCNTCKAEFESLQDQRTHFKSDVHRFNVKLSIAGKDIVKEEDFNELTSDSFKDYDVSSISGSEDEADTGSFLYNNVRRGSVESVKKKLFVCLQTGEKVSIWKSLIVDESECVSYENDRAVSVDNGGCLRESQVIERLKSLIHETRDNTHLRVVLLASGGHFSGCVFDGNLIVAHKTFHRYVVRAKAGKKQSLKDANGKAIHSAGASLRRYNEQALKKEVQELLAAWKPYFDACSCVYIHAPSNNRQLLFGGEKPYFNHQHCIIRYVPLTVRRPTFKEAQRVYNQLTQITYEVEQIETPPAPETDLILSVSTIRNVNTSSGKEDTGDKLNSKGTTEVSSNEKNSEEQFVSDGSEEGEVISSSTPLHEAAQSGNTEKVLELLDQGANPCIKDEKGQTPYMLASEKEVRNTFRRFMASNLDKWDWHAAKVPSALTKEMEEAQAAKQAEKDAKRKARAKELKKLRKAKDKKAQAQAALSQNAAASIQSQPGGGSQMSKEEELKRAQAAEREKRAAAAERRLAAAAALNAQGSSTTTSPSNSQPKSGLAADINCSFCNASLAGKVPFHSLDKLNADALDFSWTALVFPVQERYQMENI